MSYLLNFDLSVSFKIGKQQREITLSVLLNALGNAFFYGRIFPKGIITGGLGKGLKST